MLFSVEQAFVGRKEIRAPLKTPAWEARIPLHEAILPMTIGTSIISLSLVVFASLGLYITLKNVIFNQ